MRIATGKIVEGKVVLEGEQFDEGASVTVIALDEAGSIDLTPAEEAELLEAVAEIDRGEFVDGADLLRALKRRV